MEANTNIIIGQNIKNIRKSLNLTQEDFAEQLNISTDFISKVENGKVGISIDNAINICNLANCSSSYLFNGIIKNPDIMDNYDLLDEKSKIFTKEMINNLLKMQNS